MGLPFVKVYAKILDSSIWLEDASTRLLWLTILCMADAQGVVRASVGGLAHRARLERGDCERALLVLSSPDPDSQSKVEDGRRIVPLETGGWLVVNHSEYRDLRTDDHIANAARVRRCREKKKAATITVTNVTPVMTEEEAEEDREAEPPTVVKGFALAPPPPAKAKTTKGKAATKPKPPVGCSDDEWSAVMEGYRVARDLGGMAAAWGAYKDNETNRRLVARIYHDGYTDTDVDTVWRHIGERLATGDHDPKWTTLEHLARSMGRYLQEAAAGPARPVLKSPINPLCRPKQGVRPDPSTVAPRGPNITIDDFMETPA